MVSSIKNDRIENTIIVFFIIICSLIVPLKSFTYFKAHSLLSSNYILLITDEGILKRFNLKLKYWDEDDAIY